MTLDLFIFGCTEPTSFRMSDQSTLIDAHQIYDQEPALDTGAGTNFVDLDSMNMNTADLSISNDTGQDQTLILDAEVIDFNIIADPDVSVIDQSDAFIAEPMDMSSPPLTIELLIPDDWSAYSGNPILTPTSNSASQGLDNIYAPEVMRHEGRWWMWYGGQGSDGRDAIFLAWSDDLVNWTKYGGIHPIPIVDHGTSNHVNDPTIVFVNSMFYMYYTEAPIAEQDEVHLATSNDGINWQKHGVALDVGPAGSWESDRVGRPSVLYEDGEFRMWYDGQIFGVARHVGYATSVDGFTWTKHSNNPIVLNEGAVDVARLGSAYVMLVEGHQGTRYYTSQDRLNWQVHDYLFGLSNFSYDRYGQVTPHLIIDQDELLGIFYGGASNECWCKNRIAAVFPSSSDLNAPGCENCLQDTETCEQLCQRNGFSDGRCGSPGSSDPAACCACSNELGCDRCLQGYSSCEEACQANGFGSGVCGAPGSTDPSACCACQ